MPTLISVSRPAAFKRGATAKPKSAAVSPSALRPADSSNARMPARSGPRGCGSVPAKPTCDCCDPAAPCRQPCRAPPDPAAPPLGNLPRRCPGQRSDHVKRHTHAGQGAAGESAVRQVWIDDDVRRAAARLRADDDRSPTRVRPFSRAASTPATLDTPLSTVTISDGAARGRERDDFRRQPVAETKAIGHQEIDVREVHGAQRAHHQ